jgi:hypothetical protein
LPLKLHVVMRAAIHLLRQRPGVLELVKDLTVQAAAARLVNQRRPSIFPHGVIPFDARGKSPDPNGKVIGPREARLRWQTIPVVWGPDAWLAD